MRPSERVTRICERLYLGCRPVTDDGVTEADWTRWLDAFELPETRRCPEVKIKDVKDLKDVSSLSTKVAERSVTFL